MSEMRLIRCARGAQAKLGVVDEMKEGDFLREALAMPWTLSTSQVRLPPSLPQHHLTRNQRPRPSHSTRTLDLARLAEWVVILQVAAS